MILSLFTGAHAHHVCVGWCAGERRELPGCQRRRRIPRLRVPVAAAAAIALVPKDAAEGALPPHRCLRRQRRGRRRARCPSARVRASRRRPRCEVGRLARMTPVTGGGGSLWGGEVERRFEDLFSPLYPTSFWGY
jgi:hypothetical protein